MTRKRAVFFDIDGTLWGRGHVVPGDTVRAVRRLRENGHYAFINSGRSQGSIHINNLTDVGWDGYVTGCGTYVQVGQKVIEDCLIEPSELDRVLRITRQYGVRIILEGRFALYLDDCEFAEDPYGKRLIADLGPYRATIEDNAGRWRAGKFSVDIDPRCDGEGWLAEMGKKYNCIRHDEHVVELVPHGCDKGSGIVKACRHLGIPLCDAIAFGDSRNDIDMFRVAGTSVVMGQASDELKAMASLVTSGPLEGGIEKALNALRLI